MCYKMCAKLVSFLQMCRPPDSVTLTLVHYFVCVCVVVVDGFHPSVFPVDQPQN